MRSLVYVGPNSLELRHEPDPVPGNDEVVVRVEAVGICGSDMHAYHGYDERRPPPTVLGHEAAGVIVAGPGKGRRGVDVQHEERDHGGEIGRLPVAVDVGLGKADITGEGALVEKPLAANADDGGGGDIEREAAVQGVGVGAEIMDGAVGQLEAEMAKVHGAEGL